MIVEVDRAAGTFRKRAETLDEAPRLRHEARVLEVARHPGVVELLTADTDAVTLRLIDGETLSERNTLPAEELGLIGASAAATLADLHDIGVVHGSITAEHIVINRVGQPVFCNLGHGATGAAPDAPAAYADVAALTRTLVDATTDETAARRIGNAAAEVEHLRSPARRLATRLSAVPPTRRPWGHRKALAAAAAAAALLSVALVFLVAPTTPPARVAAPRTGAPLCPPVDQNCRPIPRTAGVVTTPNGRYRIGDPGDQVVVGRWRCAEALPALLRPATGQVWVWDAWAASPGALPARLLDRIPDALSIAVDPARSGCDRLLVRRRNGGVVAIWPDQGA